VKGKGSKIGFFCVQNIVSDALIWTSKTLILCLPQVSFLFSL